MAALTVWTGLVLGHLLTYVVAYPDSRTRHLHLALTGHGWMELAAASLVAAIPAVLVLQAIRASRDPPAGPAGWLRRLVVAQAGGFAVVELVERHLSVVETATDPALLVGLVVQVLVAAVAALLLHAFGRAVHAVVTRSRFPNQPPAIPPPRPPLRDLPARRLSHLIRARRRAPPLSLPA
jgi:hypothetical protein